MSEAAVGAGGERGGEGSRLILGSMNCDGAVGGGEGEGGRPDERIAATGTISRSAGSLAGAGA